MSPGLAAVWICPGSHQGAATGWGEPVSSYKRELILPFGVFSGKEAVCLSSTPTPKKLSLFYCPWLLARVPVPSCPEQHSLAVSAEHTGVELWGCSVGAQPFQTSGESIGALGDPKPSGQHMRTARICTRHCCWCRGRLWPAFQDKDFFVQHQISLPSYSALSCFANQELGMMVVASSPLHCDLS